MGAHEVTVGNVLAWLNDSGVTFKDEWIDLSESRCPVKRSGGGFSRNTSSEFGRSESQPMIEISWIGATAFCAWLSGKEPGHTYRLPTEAEWEYAARAGTPTPFPWGSTLNGTEANCGGSSPYGTTTKGEYLEKTTPVGTYAANKWGLFDTAGNVREWCADWYGPDYYETSPEVDPRGPTSAAGAPRVFRGGGWFGSTRSCRSAFRSGFTPDFGANYLGFRVARVLSGQVK
jgi:formylglycine-generating enzyme required for sulfatase activity